MSYIRGNANPECLYIVSSTDPRLSIFHNSTLKTIPHHIFHGLLKRYLLDKGYRGNEDDFRYRGASLRLTTRKRKKRSVTKWKLSFEDWHIYMWDATLYQIAHRNAFRILTKKEFQESTLGSNYLFEKEK